MKRSLIVDTHASRCYFRTSVGGDGRKALVQITERCNLHCAHCFVSSTATGADMAGRQFVDRVLPRLLAGPRRAAHPDRRRAVRAPRHPGVLRGGGRGRVYRSACARTPPRPPTSRSTELAALGNVHVNVSLRRVPRREPRPVPRRPTSFATTVATTRRVRRGRPASRAAVDAERADRCRGVRGPVRLRGRGRRQVRADEPAVGCSAGGCKSQGRLAAPTRTMRAIREVTERFADQLDLVHIRFPNDDKPLGGCDAGKIIYVFVDGTVGVCPYLVFAARTPQSTLPGHRLPGRQHPRRRRRRGCSTPTTSTTASRWAPTLPAGRALAGACGKGCPAALVSRGQLIGEVDAEQCPVVPADRAAAPAGAGGPAMSDAFIAVEGPNGVGKTTIAKLLATRLHARSGSSRCT